MGLALLIYAIGYVISILSMVVLSFIAHQKEHKSEIEIQPSVSFIATVFNEEVMICDSINSLLSQDYCNYKVIISDDGSTDSSFEKVASIYNLVQLTDIIIQDKNLKHKAIKSVWQSQVNPKLFYLIKENGGKADAMNAGLSLCDTDYYIGTDGDSSFLPNSISRFVEVLNHNDNLIGIGCSIMPSNGSHYEDGILKESKLSKNIFVLFQTIEYLRSFLVSRVGFSHVDGLLIISGAVGFFRTDKVVECGGYNSGSMGEDIEMLMRLRLHFKEHQCTSIRDALLSTEVPQTLRSIHNQRVRWTKGLIDTLKIHWRYLLRGGVVGLWTYPHFVLYEMMEPLVRFVGILFMIYTWCNSGIYLGLISLSIIYVINTLSTVSSILFDNKHNCTYKDYSKLFFYALIEPITYQPLLMFFSLKGMYQYFTSKNHKWGAMERKGYDNNINKN